MYLKPQRMRNRVRQLRGTNMNLGTISTHALREVKRLKKIHEIERDPRVRVSTTETIEIWLNVYHLVDERWNTILRCLGIGIYHCAIELNGMEWSFGEPLDPSNALETGVFGLSPSEQSLTRYRRMFLGHTVLSLAQVNWILQGMEREWLSSRYHVLHCNCNHFSAALARRLQTIEKIVIPAWINRAAVLGNLLVPMKFASWIIAHIDEEIPNNDCGEAPSVHQTMAANSTLPSFPLSGVQNIVSSYCGGTGGTFTAQAAGGTTGSFMAQTAGGTTGSFMARAPGGTTGSFMAQTAGGTTGSFMAQAASRSNLVMTESSQGKYVVFRSFRAGSLPVTYPCLAGSTSVKDSPFSHSLKHSEVNDTTELHEAVLFPSDQQQRKHITGAVPSQRDYEHLVFETCEGSTSSLNPEESETTCPVNAEGLRPIRSHIPPMTVAPSAQMLHFSQESTKSSSGSSPSTFSSFDTYTTESIGGEQKVAARWELGSRKSPSSQAVPRVPFSDFQTLEGLPPSIETEKLLLPSPFPQPINVAASNPGTDTVSPTPFHGVHVNPLTFLLENGSVEAERLESPMHSPHATETADEVHSFL